MPRGRKLTPLWTAAEDWKATRDRNGQWAVVNARGEDVLHHTDVMRRMVAVHLAAEAPALRALLWHVTTRLKNILQDHGCAYSRDMELVRTALAEISNSRPAWERAQEVRRQGGVQELPLDQERAGPADPGRRRARGVG